MKYRRASKIGAMRFKDELKNLVAEQFEVSQQRRELELKWRKENKQQIIDKRVSAMLSQKLSSQRSEDRRGPAQPGMAPPGFYGMPPRE